MTNGILSAIESFTGHRPDGCPWRAMFHPFVHRIVTAHRFYEDGNLSGYLQNASHRTWEGVGFYHGMLNAVHARQMRNDREQRDRGR